MHKTIAKTLINGLLGCLLYSLPTNAEQFEEISKLIDNKAKTQIVRIFDSKTNRPGSGVLVKKLSIEKSNRYLVVTNAHVIDSQYQSSCDATKVNANLQAETPDGNIHKIRLLPQSQELCRQADLAILYFDTYKDRSYEIATVKNSNSSLQGQNLYVSGFPCSANACEKIDRLKIIKSEGAFVKEELDNGYKIGYQADTVRGMSGGGVFDREGHLIGIHGRGSVSITGVRPKEFDRLEPSKIESLRKYSWAIPSESFLFILQNIKVANTPLKEKIDIKDISDRLNILEIQNEELKKKIAAKDTHAKSLQQNINFLNNWLFYLSSILAFLFAFILCFSFLRYHNNKNISVYSQKLTNNKNSNASNFFYFLLLLTIHQSQKLKAQKK